VRACAAAIAAAGLELDAIICNAGVMAPPKLELARGYELQFFANHIGHFILVNALLDRLTADGRVVVLSSGSHTRAPAGGIEFDNLDGSKAYAPLRNYGRSKFANILFAEELARRLAGTRRTANAVHPGVIRTNLIRHNPLFGAIVRMLSPIFLKDVAQGAATQVYVATNPALAAVSGKYFADCNVAVPRADAKIVETAKKLWAVSKKIAAKV
jgi:WW domain-containing oxidoreductase